MFLKARTFSEKLWKFWTKAFANFFENIGAFQNSWTNFLLMRNSSKWPFFEIWNAFLSKNMFWNLTTIFEHELSLIKINNLEKEKGEKKKKSQKMKKKNKERRKRNRKSDKRKKKGLGNLLEGSQNWLGSCGKMGRPISSAKGFRRVRCVERSEGVLWNPVPSFLISLLTEKIVSRGPRFFLQANPIWRFANRRLKGTTSWVWPIFPFVFLLY